MNRRMALRILALSLAAVAARVGAQQSGSIPVVGLLITHPPATGLVVTLLRDGLRKFGYEDGRNVKLEVRTALGHLDHVPALAEELVRLPVDVIVVVNEIALRAVTQATDSIPIVLVGYINEPVSAGWIESYRRPGGNLTGVFSLDLSLGAKRLEILKEILPSISRVAVLWDPAFGGQELADIEAAARSLSLEVVPIQVSRADDLATALKTIKHKHANAVLLTWSPAFWMQRDHVAVMFREAALPTISNEILITKAGGLVSYGSDHAYNWERAAYFIDRLLRGASPAEMPIEQVMRLKFAVNMKAAKALGITIPQSILLRADEVIE
jgi:putative ABC transport system substrate-binding protein